MKTHEFWQDFTHGEINKKHIDFLLTEITKRDFKINESKITLGLLRCEQYRKNKDAEKLIAETLKLLREEGHE